MTGFGRGEVSGSEFRVVVEIKSVNHRFKDLKFKMASIFNSVELNLRKVINDLFKRGSFDIYVTFKKIETQEITSLKIDETKVLSFLKEIEKFSQKQSVPISINGTDFLRSEFSLDEDLSSNEDLKKQVIDAFEIAAKELLASRLEEGEKLAKILKTYRDTYESEFKTIEDKSKEFKVSIEQKLRKKIDEIASEVKIDEGRYLQEVIYYLEKIDIHEELGRIKAHLEKFDRLIETGGEVGRKIDFFVQELNRETNTIGSKSGIEKISNAVVNMKVQLEKIREQGLNIE